MGTYVELGVTLGGLVEAGLLDLGRPEAARGSAEQGLADQSPAGSHSGNGGHSCSGSCVDEFAEDWRQGKVGENREIE